MVQRFPRGNQILGLLDDGDYSQLLPKLKHVALEVPEVLYEVHGNFDFAYFPITGALSAVVVMEDGAMIEVGTVGNEGAVGLPTFGASNTSTNRVFVQVGGDAMRVAFSELARLVAESKGFRQLVGRHHSAFFFQVSRCVACNGLHHVQQRCARWLLMTHDRVGSDELLLTHELLAVMLGVRRASVTQVVQSLQERGLIQGARGRILILDRAGLQKAACECYEAISTEYERLLSSN